MEVEDKLNAAVLGVGSTGCQDALYLRKSPEVELKAVYDPRAEVAEQVARECGCRHYIEIQPLFEAERLDFVVIAMPALLHKQLVLLAAQKALKGIICECPLAVTSAEARQMLQAVQASGTRLLLLNRDRFLPFFRVIKLALDMGVLGEPLYADVKLDSDACLAVSLADGQDLNQVEGFSPAQCLLGHMLDLICWWFAPARVKQVMGIKQSRNSIGEAELYDSFLLFDNGLKARVKSEWARSVPKLREFILTITGTHGGLTCTESPGFASIPGLRLEFHKQGDMQKALDFRELLTEWGIHTRLLVGRADPVVVAIEVLADEEELDSETVLAHYVRCLKTGQDVVENVPGVGKVSEAAREAWQPIKIIEAIEQSARSQTPLEVDQQDVAQIQL